ncbi:hypothetical protein P4O66_005518, partial [Electrophorus voltai]
HPDSQPLFAFTFQDRHYVWCRLPQGFLDSPAVFSAVVRDALASWAPPEGCVIISYADDILLSSPTEERCVMGSRSLLKHLASCGFKVSPSKLQWCKLSVTYLGFLLSAGGRRLSEDRRVICDIPPPYTKQAMLSFLGLVNYCRQWVPDCSIHEKVLGQGCRKDCPDTLVWTETMHQSFRTLKSASCSAPALGLPNYNLPFHLYEHGGSYGPVAYLSKTFDSVCSPAELMALTRACHLFRDQVVTMYTDSRHAFGVAHDF